MKRGLTAAACIAAFMSISTAEAATFKFDWTAASGATANDTSVTATGLFEIDASAGEIFDEDDVTDFSITVSGLSIVDFVLTKATAGAEVIMGRIAADGLTVSLTDLFIGAGRSPLTGKDPTPFGCENIGCGTNSGDHTIANGRLPDGTIVTTSFASTSDALGSFGLTVVRDEVSVVPLPASAPMLLAGLGLLAWWRRKQMTA